MTEIERRLAELDAARAAEEAALPPLTRAEAYAAGRYRFPPPPVPTFGWNEAAWIRFIDRDGQWIGPIKEEK